MTTLEHLQKASRKRHGSQIQEIEVRVKRKYTRRNRPKLGISDIIFYTDALFSQWKKDGRPKREEEKVVNYSKIAAAAHKIPQNDTTPSFQRPPARYDNLPTPYGIATEMLWEQLKRSG